MFVHNKALSGSGPFPRVPLARVPPRFPESGFSSVFTSHLKLLEAPEPRDLLPADVCGSRLLRGRCSPIQRSYIPRAQ